MQTDSMKRIPVRLGDRSYQIHIGRAIQSELASMLEGIVRTKSVVIVTDRNVARHHLRGLEKYLGRFRYRHSSIVIPSGESQKNPKRVLALYTMLLKEGVTRQSLLIAFGGGVIGDLAGFVAATYQRGIPLLHIPTSLLAQVDSSVGGKVGINHPRAKNMIGAFYQPLAVWTDVEYLMTLPHRQLVCGLGEVVKYAAIFDQSFFHYLETNLPKLLSQDQEALQAVISRCINEKAALVSRDEREAGERVILNLGHTIGHALESATRYRAFTHGEAVLLGMIAEGYIARKLGSLDSESLERLIALSRRILTKIRIPTIRKNSFLQAIRADKKSLRQGRNRFVLLQRIGEVQIVDQVEEKLIWESLKVLSQMHFNKQ